MGEEEQKISEKDTITWVIQEDNIRVMIKYPKRSTLKRRLEVLDKLKEAMRRW